MQFKKRKKAGKYVRAVIQLIFFLLMPSAFTTAFAGVKYIFTQIGQETQLEMTAFVTVLLVLGIYTIVFGRFFCGFACAFGSLSDAVRAFYVWICKKMKKKPVTIGDSVTIKLKYLKYVVLAAVVLLCFLGLYGKLQGTSPWDVFSMLHAGNLRLQKYLAGAVILILIVIGMCVRERFFCLFLCPMGAVFALLPVLPFFTFRRNREKCLKGCQACTRQCPAALNLPDDKNPGVSGDCFQCQKCADICPGGNIHCSGMTGNEIPVTIVKAAVLFGILFWLGV